MQDRGELAVVELQLLRRDVGDDRDVDLLEVRLGAPVVGEGGQLVVRADLGVGQRVRPGAQVVIGQVRLRVVGARVLLSARRG